MTHSIYDQAFAVEEAEGIVRYRAVALGSKTGSCIYPENGEAIIGISTHSQSRQNKAVGVRRAGIVPCEAASPIALGETVVANAEGKIQAAPKASLTIGSVGTNTAIQITSRLPGIAGNSWTINSQLADDGDGYSSIIEGTTIRLLNETNGGGTQIGTADELVQAINSDPIVSRLIVAENVSGSDGSGLAPQFNSALSGGEGGLYCIGIAQNEAIAEGDLVDVFLTL